MNKIAINLILLYPKVIEYGHAINYNVTYYLYFPGCGAEAWITGP